MKEKNLNPRHIIKYSIIILFIYILTFYSCATYKVNLKNKTYKNYLKTLEDIDKKLNTFNFYDKQYLLLLKAIIYERLKKYEKAIETYKKQEKYKYYAKKRIEVINKYYLKKQKNNIIEDKETDNNNQLNTQIKTINKKINKLFTIPLFIQFFKLNFINFIENPEKFLNSNDFKILQNYIFSNDTQKHFIITLIDDLRNSVKLYKLPSSVISKYYFYSGILNIFLGNLGEGYVDFINSFYKGNFYYYSILSLIILKNSSKLNLDNIFKYNCSTNLSFSYFFKNFKKVKVKSREMVNQKNEYLKLLKLFNESELKPEILRTVYYLMELVDKKEIFYLFLSLFYKNQNKYSNSIVFMNYYINEKLNTIYNQNLKKNNLLCFNLLKYSYPLYYLEYIKEFNMNSIFDIYEILSLIRTESYFNRFAVSQDNAIGLTQLLPSTASWIFHKTLKYQKIYEKKLFQPDIAIKGAIKYLEYLFKRGGSKIIAFASYNAGFKRLKRNININNVYLFYDIETLDIIETQIFLKKLIRNYMIYRYIYKGINFLDTFKYILKNWVNSNNFIYQ